MFADVKPPFSHIEPDANGPFLAHVCRNQTAMELPAPSLFEAAMFAPASSFLVCLRHLTKHVSVDKNRQCKGELPGIFCGTSEFWRKHAPSRETFPGVLCLEHEFFAHKAGSPTIMQTQQCCCSGWAWLRRQTDDLLRFNRSFLGLKTTFMFAGGFPAARTDFTKLQGQL